MNFSTSCHFGVTLLYLVGIALIGTSQATVSWISDLGIRYGLYQLCAASSCVFIDWSFHDETLEFFVCRIVLLVADLFAVGGILAAFIAFCLRPENQKTAMKCAGSFNIVAGISVWGATGAFTALNILVGIVGSSDQAYLYGYIISWIAGFVMLLGGVIDVMAAAHEVEVPPSAPVVKNFDLLPIDSTPPPPYNPAYHAASHKAASSLYPSTV